MSHNQLIQKLVLLRKRAGYTSRSQMAKAMGYKGPSGYQRYEDHDYYQKDYYPMDFIQKAMKALVGRGTPPVTEDEVMALGAPEGFRETVEQGVSRLKIIGKLAWDTDHKIWIHPEAPTQGIVPAEGQFGIEVVDDILETIHLPKGTILHCIDTQYFHPSNNDDLIIKIKKMDFTLYELRKYVVEPDGEKILVDPTNSQPPLKMDDMPDDREIDIAGKVIWAVRKIGG